mgnify:CR=1 FL=1
MTPKIKIYILSLGIFLFGFSIGYFITSKNIQINQNYTETHDFNTNLKYISPLLSCGNPSSNTLTDLKQKVVSTIEKQDLNHISVYFRDLNNGPWFGINENTLFSPASLVKVPLAIAYYKLAETDPSIFNKTVINSIKDDNSEQNIKPEKTITPNQEYTIKQLIEFMIVYSDNNSYDLLSNHIDSQNLRNVYFNLGIDLDKAMENPTGNIISVKNYASFFRILFNASYLNPQSSNELLEMLTRTTFNKGLVAGIGQGTTVAHKFGERYFTDTNERQLHDCGIVYSPQKPYLVCIMTRGTDFNSLTQSIKAISSIIFQHWQSLQSQ